MLFLIFFYCNSSLTVFIAILQNADSFAIRQLFDFFFWIEFITGFTYRQYFSLSKSKKVKNAVDNNGKYNAYQPSHFFFLLCFYFDDIFKFYVSFASDSIYLYITNIDVLFVNAALDRLLLH